LIHNSLQNQKRKSPKRLDRKKKNDCMGDFPASGGCSLKGFEVQTSTSKIVEKRC
jgi:hypothetical protein